MDVDYDIDDLTSDEDYRLWINATDDDTVEMTLWPDSTDDDEAQYWFHVRNNPIYT